MAIICNMSGTIPFRTSVAIAINYIRTASARPPGAPGAINSATPTPTSSAEMPKRKRTEAR
jgi:hypothetical protein